MSSPSTHSTTAPGTRVGLLAREPRPGWVKTRLITTLGREGAAELYQGLLTDALRAVDGASAERRVLYRLAPPDEGGSAPCEQPFLWQDVARVELREQQGDGLGPRLEAAFRDLLDGPGTRAVVIGADCPAVDAAALDLALAALATADLVLGPARDGGYVLIGLRSGERPHHELPAPSLFDGVAWGTGAVLEQTLERARAAGLEFALLPPLGDVDTAADVVALLDAIARGRRIGDATHDALHGLGLAPRRERTGD